MDTLPALGPQLAQADFELRFVCLFHPGRGVTVPCDAGGKVDLDALPKRLRTACFGARAMVGRDHDCPVVTPVQ